MATRIESPDALTAPAGHRKIGVLRLALTGAIVASLFFVLCWIGMFLPFGSPTHAYLALFTNAEITSTNALVQGVCWSALFGLVAGGLTALVYNALSALD